MGREEKGWEGEGRGGKGWEGEGIALQIFLFWPDIIHTSSDVITSQRNSTPNIAS